MKFNLEIVGKAGDKTPGTFRFHQNRMAIFDADNGVLHKMECAALHTATAQLWQIDGMAIHQVGRGKPLFAHETWILTEAAP